MRKSIRSSLYATMMIITIIFVLGACELIRGALPDEFVLLQVVVDPEGILATTEAGAQVSVELTLSKEPIEDITVTLASSDPGEGTIDVTSLVFTISDWQTAQTVTITGVDDDLLDGDQSYVIVAVATSAGEEFDDIDLPDIWVINSDDEVAEVPPVEELYDFTVQAVANGNPIPDVEILVDGESVGFTDGSGELAFTLSDSAAFDLTARKPLFVGNTAAQTPAGDPTEDLGQIEILPQIFIPNNGYDEVVRLDDIAGTNRLNIRAVSGYSFAGPCWVEVDYDNGDVYIWDLDDFYGASEGGRLVRISYDYDGGATTFGFQFAGLGHDRKGREALQLISQKVAEIQRAVAH